MSKWDHSRQQFVDEAGLVDAAQAIVGHTKEVAPRSGCLKQCEVQIRQRAVLSRPVMRELEVTAAGLQFASQSTQQHDRACAQCQSFDDGTAGELQIHDDLNFYRRLFDSKIDDRKMKAVKLKLLSVRSAGLLSFIFLSQIFLSNPPPFQK